MNYLQEIENVLKNYGYLEKEEILKTEELPDIVSYLILLRFITKEAIKFNIPYLEIEKFCDFALNYIYDSQSAELDLEKVYKVYKNE